MSRINKEVAFFIVFLILVIIVESFVKTPVDTETKVNDELKVGGMYLQFEDGVSDFKVKDVLKDYNLTMNYSIKYNIDYMEDKYYIMLDKGNWDIRNELNKAMKEEKKDWFISSPAHVVRIGDYYVLSVSEQAVQDKNFLEILDKYDIQVKKFTWCYIRFEDESKNWIPEKDAIRIKSELEKKENILAVYLDYRC
ncbi:hypothetical protein SDC9_117008 [bioreactor metagenome]|uniref:Uncharacterized protein n=1 Tax=bioreactor metagenome TaxID=1076179 RepID=A0A645BXZ6_9ZZZZ